jgi:hypothetical protein
LFPTLSGAMIDPDTGLMPLTIRFRCNIAMRPITRHPTNRSNSVISMTSAGLHWPYRAGLLAALSCLILISIPACTPSQTKEAQQEDAQSIAKELPRYSKTVGDITLEAYPFIQAERQKMVFGDDLWALAVLPVHVMVKNYGEGPVPIEVRHFKLTLPNAEVITPRSAAEVTAGLAAQGGALGRVGSGLAHFGLGPIGALAGPIGGIAGAVASGLFGLYRSNASTAREETYSRSEFKDAMLGKDQFSRGFIFFMLPVATPAFDDATLTLTVYEHLEHSTQLELPLHGLAFKGNASK